MNSSRPFRRTVPVAVFIVLLFAASWSWSYLGRPLYASSDVWLFLAGLLPSVWAPTIIALALMFWAGGATELRRELTERLSYRTGSGRWLAVAEGVPIVVAVLAVVSARAAGQGAPFVPPDAILPTIGLQLITGAIGEELGWRGYLLPRLAGKRIGPVSAALAINHSNIAQIYGLER